jgi:hypothetical protein
MNFTLHEVKLWFKDEKTVPVSYHFLPNKVNVITGDATTGKTSFWRIIDYCLLSIKPKIASSITEAVSWFGIRFTINEKEYSIARMSPNRANITSDLFFHSGALPSENPQRNTQIIDLKKILDAEFGINDKLIFPFGKEIGKSNFNISYRHFLPFISITEDIIGASETYFDTTFYGKEEYDVALRHVFDMVIGVNDLANIKANERISLIDNDLKRIQAMKTKNQTKEKAFKSGVLQLVNKLRQNQLLDHSEEPTAIEEAVRIIENTLTMTKQAADNSKLFIELDQLNRRKNEIKANINAINRYKREYDTYKRNLKKSADSLKPIEFLTDNLSEQLVDSYETLSFISSLEVSLREVESALTKNGTEPVKVSGELQHLEKELSAVQKRIDELTLISKNIQTTSARLIIAGEVKYAKEQLIKNYVLDVIDGKKIEELNSEKVNLQNNIKESRQIKDLMQGKLNASIQRSYHQLKSLPEYWDSDTLFNTTEMVLQLKPKNQLFILDNIGSKSNYMFLHLCFYLGLHEHIINVSPEHVPQFLFIDQPSIPYYSGSDNIGNDDKSKLLDAFSLLNSFIGHVVAQKNSFQIFMVEHAPKEYWIGNDLTHFHTVAEFINGKGLMPDHLLNSKQNKI